MTAADFMRLLNDALSRQPFQPFAVKLKSGVCHEIDVPDSANCRDGVAVFLAAGGRPKMFTHEEVLSIDGVIIVDKEKPQL